MCGSKRIYVNTFTGITCKCAKMENRIPTGRSLRMLCFLNASILCAWFISHSHAPMARVDEQPLTVSSILSCFLHCARVFVFFFAVQHDEDGFSWYLMPINDDIIWKQNWSFISRWQTWTATANKRRWTWSCAWESVSVSAYRKPFRTIIIIHTMNKAPAAPIYLKYVENRVVFVETRESVKLHGFLYCVQNQHWNLFEPIKIGNLNPTKKKIHRQYIAYSHIVWIWIHQ